MNSELHPNSIKNLESWKKGQSGNPAGRPKGRKNNATIIREVLENETIIKSHLKNLPAYWEDIESNKGMVIVAASMMSRAMAGDVKAASWIMKFTDGEVVNVNNSSHATLQEIKEKMNSHAAKISEARKEQFTVDREGQPSEDGVPPTT